MLPFNLSFPNELSRVTINRKGQHRIDPLAIDMPSIRPTKPDNLANNPNKSMESTYATHWALRQSAKFLNPQP